MINWPVQIREGADAARPATGRLVRLLLRLGGPARAQLVGAPGGRSRPGPRRGPRRGVRQGRGPRRRSRGRLGWRIRRGRGGGGGGDGERGSVGEGVVVEERRDGGVEVPIVALEEEDGLLAGGGGDLAEGADGGGVVLAALERRFHGLVVHGDWRRRDPSVERLLVRVLLLLGQPRFEYRWSDWGRSVAVVFAATAPPRWIISLSPGPKRRVVLE